MVAGYHRPQEQIHPGGRQQQLRPGGQRRGVIVHETRCRTFRIAHNARYRTCIERSRLPCIGRQAQTAYRKPKARLAPLGAVSARWDTFATRYAFQSSGSAGHFCGMP
eukprot:452212-Prymnesium_polylepis.4